VHNYCTPHIIKENFEDFLIHRCNYILLSQVYCVWQVVKTPTIISNNPLYCWQKAKGFNVYVIGKIKGKLCLREIRKPQIKSLHFPTMVTSVDSVYNNLNSPKICKTVSRVAPGDKSSAQICPVLNPFSTSPKSSFFTLQITWGIAETQ
jgi:hypothetical protein